MMLMLLDNEFKQIQVAFEQFIFIIIELFKAIINELRNAVILKIFKIKIFWNKQESENTVLIKIVLEIWQKYFDEGVLGFK